MLTNRLYSMKHQIKSIPMQKAYYIRFHLPDQQICQLVLKGEYGFFETLITKYNGLLYRYGRAYGFNHKSALDLVQETHVTAFTGLDRRDPEELYSSYVLKIMISKCNERYSKKPERDTLTNEEIVNNIALWHINSAWRQQKRLARKEYAHLAERSLEQLPERHAEIFVLCNIEGLDTETVARLLHITEVNVKIALSRVKILLMEKFESLDTPESVYRLSETDSKRLIERVFTGINAIISVEINTH